MAYLSDTLIELILPKYVHKVTERVQSFRQEDCVDHRLEVRQQRVVQYVWRTLLP